MTYILRSFSYDIFCGHSHMTYILRSFSYDIYSVVILSLPLIQEGYLSVSQERICTGAINRLEN